MKWILTICAAFTTLAGAETKVFDQYGYVDLGLGPAPIPIPIFGAGYRMQSNHNGFNANVRAATIVETTSVKAGIHYFHYFNPNLERQFYMGIGPAGGIVTGHWWDSHWFIAPEFVFGKSYLADTGDRRFFEMNVDFPTFGIQRSHFPREHHVINDPLWFPLVSFHYGWGF